MRASILAVCLGAVALGLTLSSVAHADKQPTVVTFENDLPAKYRLTSVRFVVDGAVRAESNNDYALARLPPGRHVVEVIASYTLHDRVFSYLDRYGIEIRSSHVVLPAREGDAHVHAVPVGGATTPVARSAALMWRTR